MEAAIDPIRLIPSEQTIVSEDISPFDVPKSMIALCDPDSGTLELQFRYISEEPSIPLSSDSPRDTKLALGKNSHRIYSLCLRLGDLEDLAHLQSRFLNVVVNIPKKLSDSVAQQDMPKANYNVIRDLIISNSVPLIDYANKAFAQACA